MSEDNQQIGNNPQLSNAFLSLGFDPDSGEWEMLVENNPNITIGQLVQRYLDIARSNYNVNWNTIDDAVNDDTGINKRNIIRDVLASYSNSTSSTDTIATDSPSTDIMDIDPNSIDLDAMDIDGGKRRRPKRRKTKRSKKSKRRQSKRRQSKKRTRRYKR